MPYFIYLVKPPAQLERLHAHETFLPASNQAKELRAALPPSSSDKIKLIHAENELQAEALLRQVRQAGPTGEE